MFFMRFIDIFVKLFIICNIFINSIKASQFCDDKNEEKHSYQYCHQEIELKDIDLNYSAEDNSYFFKNSEISFDQDDISPNVIGHDNIYKLENNLVNCVKCKTPKEIDAWIHNTLSESKDLDSIEMANSIRHEKTRWAPEEDIEKFALNTQGCLMIVNSDNNTYITSGFLIDSEHIISAAHNVYRRAKFSAAKRITFYPFMHLGESPKLALECESFVFSDKHIYDAAHEEYDFALIKLRNPLNNSKVLDIMPLESKEFIGRKVSLTGSPGKIPFVGRYMFLNEVNIFNIKDNIFLYSTCSLKGYSGGPIWEYVIDDKSRGRIIGVHIQGNGIDVGKGIFFTQAVIDQISEWKALLRI